MSCCASSVPRSIEGATPELQIHLQDTVYPLHVVLIYRVHEAYNLIERAVVATNQGDEPITIERLWSAQWHLPHGDDYRMTYVSGRWLDEMHLQREQIKTGRKILESRRITTSHNHNPWFAIDRGNADEDTRRGLVWRAGLERQLEIVRRTHRVQLNASVDWPQRLGFRVATQRG